MWIWYNCIINSVRCIINQLYPHRRLIMREKTGENRSIRTAVVAVSITASIGVIVLAALQIFEVYTGAVNILVPLIGVTQLCQAYLQWNSSRKTAYFSLATAIFIFICAAVVFFMK